MERFLPADVPGTIAFIACTALITIYAWDRFNTPSSNRSSTLRALFWSSCLGYVVCALVAFAGLSYLLLQPAWQKVLGLSGQGSLPAPLMATLALTVLLPSSPMLKKVDSWLLSKFLSWGAIPAEARRLAEAMTPKTFAVTVADIKALRNSYELGEYNYGDRFPEHLREEGASGLKRSEYRFTRVAKLYDRIRRLAAETRYRRFFVETGHEFADLEREIDDFMRRAVTGLDGVGQSSGIEGDTTFQSLLSEWHGRFADDCFKRFVLLARFLARAVLRSEPSKAEITARLQEIGFEMNEPPAPDFPLDSLTALALGIFVYLAVATIWFSSISHKPVGTGLLLATKITLARVAAIGMTVWLLQNFAFFRRKTGDQPRYFAYVVNGILAGALAAGVGELFRIGIGGDVLFTQEEERIGILSGILCTAVAFCCDDWSKDSAPPAWFPWAEAIGCGIAMAVGTTLLWYTGWGPTEREISPELLMATWITLPSLLATMIGAYVPRIYRGCRRSVGRSSGTAAPPHESSVAPMPV